MNVKHTNKQRTSRATNNESTFIYSFIWAVCVRASDGRASECVFVICEYIVDRPVYRELPRLHIGPLRARLCVCLTHSLLLPLSVCACVFYTKWFHSCLYGSKIESYDLIRFFFRVWFLLLVEHVTRRVMVRRMAVCVMLKRERVLVYEWQQEIIEFELKANRVLCPNVDSLH